MSEREKRENARRRGKRAFYEGVPLKDNPMRARDSQLDWRRGWLEEQQHDADNRRLILAQRKRLGL